MFPMAHLMTNNCNNFLLFIVRDRRLIILLKEGIKQYYALVGTEAKEVGIGVG
jgi:hypothetical protein